MKSFEDMAQSALARGKAIRKQRNRTNKIIISTFLGLAVCCLLMLLAFDIWGEGDKLVPAGNPLNYGSISFISEAHKTESSISGQSFRYLAGTSNPGDSQANAAPPWFHFRYGFIHVVARALEEYPGVYETLNEYGSTQTYQYRLFRMEVIDPLESGMEGTFFYLLPIKLKGDLTQYDTLLISMHQLPKNYALQKDGQLVFFDYLFVDPYDRPELGNIIAFTDGVFDESLWQDRSWYYGYQFAKHQLNDNDDMLLVFRGATLEEALQRRQVQIQEWGDRAKTAQVNHFVFRTEAAKEVMAYVKPLENGVFIPDRIYADYRQDYYIRRYINGCPTNERLYIDYGGETVTVSEHRFEDADYENLPDLAAYIASLDLSQIVPQHTDSTGKVMIYNSAVGWYEKTEAGVYSVVRIAWRYFAEDDYSMEYYDETFILLDETGDHLISREDLIELIGENCNISKEEYGVGICMPMC